MNKQKIGWIGLIMMACSPLIFWVMRIPLTIRFSDVSTTATSIGQITGLVALSLYAVTLVLSGRYRWIEEIFGGSTKVYQIHHILGGVSFILILLHPLFLAGSYATFSLKAAAALLLPGSDMTINLGIIALYGTLILLVLTFFIKLPYFTWKATHKFLGVAFAFSVLHSFLVSSDISSYLPLRIYMLVFFGVGLGSYFKGTILRRILTKDWDYMIIKVYESGEHMIKIDAKPTDRVIGFRPGQFVFLRFPQDSTDTNTYPFTILSSPSEASMKLTLESLGIFPARTLRPGVKIKIRGPMGKLRYEQFFKKDQIWIVSGIGIIPFLSVVHSMEQSSNIRVYYVIYDQYEVAYMNELSLITSKMPNIKAFLYSTREHGKLTVEMLEKDVGDFAGKEIIVAGPPLIAINLRSQFNALHSKGAKIHYEILHHV